MAIPTDIGLVDALARAFTNGPSKHLHLCADHCGDFFVCSRRDGCDTTWICPNCETERLDHYTELQQAAQILNEQEHA